MKAIITLAGALVALWAAPLSAAPDAPERLSAADRAAAFKAAGYTLKGRQWRACDDPAPPYVPGSIELVRDLNGDGRPEVLITEGSTSCYGNAGAGYSLLSRQADGRWKLMARGIGILGILASKGADGWPDLEIGGPGFCFPVERWNGRQYVLHRQQYEGKPCRGR